MFFLSLKSPKCSGRAIKFEPLKPSEIDALMLEAAKAIGPEGTMIELRKMQVKNGILNMVKEVTVEAGLYKDGQANQPDTKWKKYTYQTLEAEYDTLFTSRDHAILEGLYHSYHEVNGDELQAIMGNAVMVSEG